MARGVYRSGQIGLINIPTLSGSEYKSLASGFSDLENRINSIVTYSTQQGAIAAKTKAAEFVASNPLTIADVGTMSGEQKQKYFGDQNTVYGREMKILQSGLLAADAVNVGREQIQKLEQDTLLTFAATGFIDSSQYDEDVSAIVNGISEALVGIDVDEAIKAKNTLGINAKSSLQKITNQEVERIQFVRREKAEAASALVMSDLELLAETYGSQIPYVNETTGKEEFIDTETYVQDLIADTTQNLIAAGSPLGETFLADAQTAYYGSVRTYIEKHFRETTILTDAESIYEEVVNGDFGGDTERKAMYDNLPQEYKDQVLKNVDTWYSNLITAEQKLDEANLERFNNNLTGIKVDFYGSFSIAGQEGINIRESALDDAFALAPIDDGALYKELQKYLIDKDLDVVSDPRVKADLEERIRNKTAEYEEIQAASGVTISHADASGLATLWLTTQDKGITNILDRIALKADWTYDAEVQAERVGLLVDQELKMRADAKTTKLNKIASQVYDFAMSEIPTEEGTRKPTLAEVEAYALDRYNNYDTEVQNKVITDLKTDLRTRALNNKQLGINSTKFIEYANEYNGKLGDLNVRDIASGDLIKFDQGTISKYFLNDIEGAKRLKTMLDRIILSITDSEEKQHWTKLKSQTELLIANYGIMEE